MSMKRIPLNLMKAVGNKKFSRVVEDWGYQRPTLPEKPSGRACGNEVIRRYPNGVVDHMGTAEKALLALQELNVGSAPLYAPDVALLVLIFPGKFGHMMDQDIARSYCRQVDQKDIDKIKTIIRNSVVDPQSLED